MEECFASRKMQFAIGLTVCLVLHLWCYVLLHPLLKKCNRGFFFLPPAPPLLWTALQQLSVPNFGIPTGCPAFRYLPEEPASRTEKKFNKFSPSLCEVLWPVDRIRLEADTCHRNGWYEIDGIQMRGGVVPPVNILNTTAELAFIPTRGFVGTFTFGLTATDCYGSFPATSEPKSVTVEVKPPQYMKNFTAHETGTQVNVVIVDGPTSGKVTISNISDVQVCGVAVNCPHVHPAISGHFASCSLFPINPFPTFPSFLLIWREMYSKKALGVV